MTTEADFIRSAFKVKGIDADSEVIKNYVKEKYKISVRPSNIRLVRSRIKGAGKQAEYPLNYSSVRGSRPDVVSDETLVSPRPKSDSVGDVLRSNDSSNSSGSGVFDSQIGGPQRLEDLPQKELVIDVKAAPTPPEAEEIAEQYQERVRELGGESPEGKPPPSGIGVTAEKVTAEPQLEEEIDSKLMGDNMIELAELSVNAISPDEPLSAADKSKGSMVISRMIKRRLPLVYAYGDVVNVILWVIKVFPRRIAKRIFRLRPLKAVDTTDYSVSGEVKEDNTE